MKKPNRFTDDPKARVLACTYCSRRDKLSLKCEEYPTGIPGKVMDEDPKQMPCFKQKK